MRKASVGCLFAVAALVGWCVLWYCEMKRLSPPGDTLADFLAGMPEPREWRVISVEGKEYLVAHGEMRHLLTGPSGAAAYIFDRAGRLVVWTPDTGDAGEDFHREWPGLWGGQAVDSAAAARWADR
jgi:hypothetical protein